jgi:electron transport complex protein RnfA
MPNNFVWFLTLAIFSGMSMNMILQFGIGLRQTALYNTEENSKGVFFVRAGLYFLSIMILWLFFSFLQSVLFLGFFEYILVFPAAYFFFLAVEYLSRRLLLSTNWRGEIVSRGDFISECLFIDSRTTDNEAETLNSAFSNGAPAGAALFIMLGLADGFAQAAAFSFGFSAGSALAVLIVVEIRRRSAMEAVPRSLRGVPLILVTLGLLSLVFTSVAMALYNVLGAN